MKGRCLRLPISQLQDQWLVLRMGPRAEGNGKGLGSPRPLIFALVCPLGSPVEQEIGVGGPTPEGLSWIPREVGAEKPTGETELCSMGNLSRPGSTWEVLGL